jgi:phage shock protein PspC (stress-responsive transcriptional regulator)
VSEERQNQTPLVIIGIALLIAGLWGLGNVGLPLLSPVLVPVRHAWAEIRPWLWAGALIALGIMAIVAGTRGGFHIKLPSKEQRLYRSRSDKMVSGVLGGLATYFAVDVTVLRLAFVAVMLVTGFWAAFWTYIVASVIVPMEPATQAAAPPPPRAG